MGRKLLWYLGLPLRALACGLLGGLMYLLFPYSVDKEFMDDLRKVWRGKL